MQLGYRAKKSIAVPGSATEAGGGAESSGTNGGGADQASADEGINEQVLVDQDGIKITATEYVTDSIWGDGIKLLVENNSAKDYTIGCDALIVNDYMITDLFSADVAAGKKSNEVMYLSSTELKAAGIDTVGQIEMYFHAYDSNWDNLFKNVYSKLETSEFANMDTTPNDEGQELYNANGVRIVGKQLMKFLLGNSNFTLHRKHLRSECRNKRGQYVYQWIYDDTAVFNHSI